MISNTKMEVHGIWDRGILIEKQVIEKKNFFSFNNNNSTEKGD
jgi:hypothetical protein